MVEIEGPPYIDMDICLSGLLQNSGICWDATRGSSVGAFLHAVVVTGTDNVTVLAIGKKKKKDQRCGAISQPIRAHHRDLDCRFSGRSIQHIAISSPLSPHRT